MDRLTARCASADRAPSHPQAAGEWGAFLARMLRHPRIVGAIAPSSEMLAQAMLGAAQPLRRPVLELGAGTGVFSRALLRAGLAPEALYVVERLPEFAEALSAQLPGVRVLALDAAQVQPAQFAHPPETVVSGLPLRAMRETQVEAILRAVLAACSENVRMVQFSYGLRCPVPAAMRQRLGLRAERVRWVAINLPPAWVWRLRRAVPAE